MPDVCPLQACVSAMMASSVNDILHAAGTIGAETAMALKAEARRRVEAGTFFGHIAYTSLIARKPS